MNTFDDLFVSDQNKANNGIPITVGYNKKDEPVIFWIAEAGCPGHEKAQRKYAKELEVSRRNSKHMERLMATVIAEGILKKWKGVMDVDGNYTEPTVENKVAALLKYKKLYLQVLQEANDLENYRNEDTVDDMTDEEALEDTAGNLEAS